MRTVNQCALCGARDSVPHQTGCKGRKVKIPVYGRADQRAAEEAGWPARPANIRCFDNGGTSADRYTLIRTTPTGHFKDTQREERGRCAYFATYSDISANSHPYHPQGIGITGETCYAPLWNAGKWGSQAGRLAAKVGYKPARWADLPEQVKRCCWDLASDEQEP